MKAIYLSSKSGPEGLVAGEIPRPNPKDDEVLVKVHATSVSPTEFDWFTTFNLPFGEPRPFPIVLNHEFSGMVESVGAAVTVSWRRVAVWSPLRLKTPERLNRACAMRSCSCNRTVRNWPGLGD